MLDQTGSFFAAMTERAATLDAQRRFPAEDIAALTEAGALIAPFPTSLGGEGLAENAGSAQLARLLRLLGRGNLAVGRLYEAHVNAVRLLRHFATPALLARAAADARDGMLIGLWVTDPPTRPLHATDGLLHGSKLYCSGAGHVRRAVVTLAHPSGTRLAYLATDPARATPMPEHMQGMRAAVTGAVDFTGARLSEADLLGPPDAYLREPEFSAGAWRTAAVICGGAEALVACAMRQLVARGRHTDPHQLARMGQAWIALETARMWLERARRDANRDHGADEIITSVNLARTAISAACHSAQGLVERSIGLAAFLNGNPIERIGRDLATYLCQPAPDEILAAAAAHLMRGCAETAP